MFHFEKLTQASNSKVTNRAGSEDIYLVSKNASGHVRIYRVVHILVPEFQMTKRVVIVHIVH